MAIRQSAVALVLAWLCGSGAANAQDAALLARGTYLMEGIVACGNCHLARGPQGEPLFAKGLSGGMPFVDDAFEAHAPNITPDAETGIGRWTDAQLARAIREGIRPDGRLIGPPMPIEFYRRLSDRDLAAIVAYLRAQPPVRNVVPKSTYRMPLPASYGPPVGTVPAPDARSAVARGAYLAAIGHCMECHTPRDAKGMLRMDRLGAGGQRFPGPWGESVSRNLTPHASGLKSWTDAEIARAIRTGVDRAGHPYRPPMAYAFYAKISDVDIADLIAYLRTLKPQPGAAAN